MVEGVDDFNTRLRILAELLAVPSLEMGEDFTQCVECALVYLGDDLETEDIQAYVDKETLHLFMQKLNNLCNPETVTGFSKIALFLGFQELAVIWMKLYGPEGIDR